ncbi:MAG: TonB-dependent receptor, partial [Burkholderiaceae bacterium]
MDEIIVTARKVAETLQEAPVAISVVTSEQIELTGASDLSDLTKRLPNVAANYPSADPLQNVTAIRGFVTGARNIGFDSGLGIFIDGAYAGRIATGNKTLPDVERIEFLPGPQATLFGKNTTLGVMNVVPKKPGDELEANASVSAGNMGLLESRASVRGPIGETFGAGFTFGSRQHDGFIRNQFDGSLGPEFESYGGVFQLTAESDAFNAHFMVDYNDQNYENAYFDSRIGGFDALPIDTIDNNFPNVATAEELGVTLTWTWELGPGTLTSISGLRNFDTERSHDDEYYDFSVIDLEFFDESQDHFGQELRYAGTAGALGYLFGAYYQTQQIESLRSADVFGLSPELRVIGRVDTDALAVFGNLTYDLTDRFAVELGGRWSEETKKLRTYTQSGSAPIGLLEFTVEDFVADGVLD